MGHSYKQFLTRNKRFKGDLSLIWTDLKNLYPRMFHANFGWKSIISALSSSEKRVILHLTCLNVHLLVSLPKIDRNSYSGKQARSVLGWWLLKLCGALWFCSAVAPWESDKSSYRTFWPYDQMGVRMDDNCCHTERWVVAESLGHCVLDGGGGGTYDYCH